MGCAWNYFWRDDVVSMLVVGYNYLADTVEYNYLEHKRLLTDTAAEEHS